MSHQLQEHVAIIRRRVRGALLLYSVGVVTFVLLISVGLLGSLDAVLRIQEAGWHYVSFALTVFVVGATVFWVIVPVLRLRLDDVDIARRIERIYPHLKDRLSSSVAFLRQSDAEPTAGSAELRRTMIASTLSDYPQVDPDDIVDLGPVYRLGLLIVFLALVCLGLFSLQPVSARLALSHLLMPWREEAWPRRHDLALVGAKVRAARGTDVEFVVVDRNGDLPAAVQLLIWAEPTDESDVKPLEMIYRGGKMVCRVEKVRSSFWYRAVGGDDDAMKWHPLDVIEPVRIADLEIRVIPPAYTGLSTRTYNDSFTAWEGSQVDVSGRATKPLSAATLNWRSETANGFIPLAVSQRAIDSNPNALGFRSLVRSPWIVHESGSYWLELVGPKNLVSGLEQRWPLYVVLDRPPTLSLAERLTSTEVTPAALIPIRLTVDDELGVRRVELRYTRSDQPHQPEVAIELFAGPDKPRVVVAATDTIEPQRDRHQIDTSWDLTQVRGLAPGASLMVRYVASDYQPQEGEIPPRRINVISAADKQSRIVQRQTSLLGQLGQIVQSQRDVRDDTELLHNLLTSDMPGQDSVDQVRSLELRQRTVHQRLSLDPESVSAQVGRLLDEIELNRISIPEVRRELEKLRATLSRLSREPLGIADNLLTRSAKALREAGQAIAASGDIMRWLRETDGHQQRVVDELSDSVKRLRQWEGYQQFVEDIRAIARQQQDLMSDTQALRSRMISRDKSTSDPDDDLFREQIARRELELSRRLHRLQERVEQTAARLIEGSPQAAAALSEAVAVARRNALGGRMRETSRQIRAQQLGQAIEQQREILNGLGQVAQRLSGDSENEQSQQQVTEKGRQRQNALSQQLARIETAVSALKKQQEQVNEITAQLIKLANLQNDAPDSSAASGEISVRQRTLAEATVALADELDSLPAFVLALRRAAEYMDAAASLLEENVLQGDGSQGQAALPQAARPQAAALQSLDQILAAISQPPEQQPSARDANSTADGQTGKQAQRAGAGREQLQLLKIVQQHIAARTIEIDTAMQRQGMLDAVLRQDLIWMAKQQAELADVVRQLAPAASNEKEPVDDETSDGPDIESKLRRSLQRTLDEK